MQWIIQTLATMLLAFMAMVATGAASAANPQSAGKTVLVLGDSLSAEYGLQRGAGWVTLLEKRMQEKRVNANIANASISGETTSGGRARLPALLEKHRPAVVIIELGGNDGLRGLSVAATEANLRSMIAESTKSGARVLLAGMQIPPNYGRAYTEQFARMYGKLARETKSGLVPFFLEGVADKPDLFQGDRIHPTAAAQPVLVDNVWPHLAPLLK